MGIFFITFFFIRLFVFFGGPEHVGAIGWDASANLVVAGMSEKAGYKIKFVEFMKMGLLIMVITVAISNVYIYFRFL